MSLMRTLTRVAVGILVAKTVGGLMNAGRSGGGIGGGGPMSGGRGTRPGGLEDMMGEIFARARPAGGQGTGGQAGRMGPAGPWGQDARPAPVPPPARPQADPVDPLGQVAGPLVVPEPGGGAGPWGQPTSGGDRVNSPASEDEALAGLMLRAMIQAAKCDGRIDAVESRKIMEGLGGSSDAEMALVRQLLLAPVDVAGLCRDVPAGQGAPIYEVSLLAIAPDSGIERAYLADLASGLGLDGADLADIHRRAGVDLAAG